MMGLDGGARWAGSMSKGMVGRWALVASAVMSVPPRAPDDHIHRLGRRSGGL